MAKFQIQAPNGHTYEISAPDGASQQDVFSVFQQQLSSMGGQMSTQQDNGPSATQRVLGSALARTNEGLANLATNITGGPNNHFLWGQHPLINTPELAQQYHQQAQQLAPQTGAQGLMSEGAQAIMQLPEYGLGLGTGKTEADVAGAGVKLFQNMVGGAGRMAGLGMGELPPDASAKEKAKAAVLGAIQGATAERFAQAPLGSRIRANAAVGGATGYATGGAQGAVHGAILGGGLGAMGNEVQPYFDSNGNPVTGSGSVSHGKYLGGEAGTPLDKTVASSRVQQWGSLVREAADSQGVPPDLMMRILAAESGGNPHANSGKAQGLFQFTPGTAEQYGIDPNDPHQAAYAAAAHLKHLYGVFGDWTKAVAAYNAGEGAIAKGRMPAETAQYVAKIFGNGPEAHQGFLTHEGEMVPSEDLPYPQWKKQQQDALDYFNRVSKESGVDLEQGGVEKPDTSTDAYNEYRLDNMKKRNATQNAVNGTVAEGTMPPLERSNTDGQELGEQQQHSDPLRSALFKLQNGYSGATLTAEERIALQLYKEKQQRPGVVVPGQEQQQGNSNVGIQVANGYSPKTTPSPAEVEESANILSRGQGREFPPKEAQAQATSLIYTGQEVAPNVSALNSALLKLQHGVDPAFYTADERVALKAWQDKQANGIILPEQKQAQETPKIALAEGYNSSRGANGETIPAQPIDEQPAPLGSKARKAKRTGKGAMRQGGAVHLPGMDDIKAIAKYLGLSEDEVRQHVENGALGSEQSDVARSSGMTGTGSTGRANAERRSMDVGNPNGEDRRGSMMEKLAQQNRRSEALSQQQADIHTSKPNGAKGQAMKQGGAIRFPFGGAEERGAPDTRSEKEKLQEKFGYSNEANPEGMQRYLKEDGSNKLPDYSVEAKEGTNFIPGSFMGHKVTRWFVDQAVSARNNFKAIRHVLNERLKNSYEKLNYSDRTNIWKVMHEMSKQQREPTEEALREGIDVNGHLIKLNQRQIASYMNIRNHVRDLLALVNEKREAVGLKPLGDLEGYLPSIWNGDFKVYVKGENGHNIYVSAHNYKFQANKAYKELQKIFADKEGVTVHKPELAEHQNPYDLPLDGINELKNFFKGDEDLIQKLQATEEAIRSKRGFGAHGIHKRFAGGHLGDDTVMPIKDSWKNTITATNAYSKQWEKALDNFTDRALAHAEKLDVANRTAKAFSVLGDHNYPNAKYAAQRYLDLAHGGAAISHHVDEIAGIVTKWLSLGQAGPSAANRAVRFTNSFATRSLLMFYNARMMVAIAGQPFNTVPLQISRMASTVRGNSLAGQGMSIVDAAKYMAKGMNSYMKGVEGAAGSKEREWAKWAAANGVVEPKFVESWAGMSNSSKYAQVAGHVTGTNTVKFLEKHSRLYAFFSYANYLQDHGFKGDELLRTAAKMTNKYMAEYDKAEKAPVFTGLGPKGELLSNLKTFTMNYFGQRLELLQDAKNEGHWAPLAIDIVTQMALTGAMGMPFLDEYDWMVKHLREITGWNIHTLKEKMLGTLPDWMTFGFLDAVTGMHLSSSLAAPETRDVLGEPSLEYLIDAGKDIGTVAAKTAGQALGLSYGPSAADKQAAIQSVTPSSLQVLGENYFGNRAQPYMSTLDKMTTTPTTPIANDNKREAGIYKRNDFDTTARMFSAHSLNEQKSKLATQEIRADKAAQSKDVQRIVEAFADHFEGTRSLSPQEMAELAQKAQQSGTTPMQLQRDIKHLIMQRMMTQSQQMVKKGTSLRQRQYYDRFNQMGVPVY